MRRTSRLLQAATTLFVLSGFLIVVGPAIVQADLATTPSLVISQLKITSSNGQFVTLYNTTATTLDMSKYQLEYFNSYDLSKATSSRLIALTGILPPHSYYLINDSSQLLCYQLTVDSVNLGFSSTAGLVEVLAFNQSGPGLSVVPALQDVVGWSKTAVAGAQTLPTNGNAFLQRQPLDAQHNPLITNPGTGSWQPVMPDPVNTCNFVTTAGANLPIQPGSGLLLPGSEPPVTISNTAFIPNDPTPSTQPTALPTADIGLMAPKITELLPNPAGTGNDATDEFIELYNPNSVSFDLSGFGLRSGVSTYHSYIFPSGTMLLPQSFVAFYSETTNLSLSNTKGMAALLDPTGAVQSSSEAYVNAKDGQSWSLANGKWLFTTNVTPGSANIISAPISAKQKLAAAAQAKTAHAAKAIKIPKVHKAASKTHKKPKVKKATKLAAHKQSTAPSTPIHPWTLALVPTGALLYAAYEYRADMANRVYQFKRQLSARRAARQKT